MAKKSQEEQHIPQIEDKIDNSILEARRILISSAVDSDLAYQVIRHLWYLEFSDPGKPIIMVINSPGGSVDDGFAIWDQIKMISSPVTTLVTGLAASMGSILSLAAAPKRRFSTPNARFMIHQPSMGLIQGQASDLDIQAKEILKTRDKIIKMYCELTGKDYETIKRALDRDTWMSAEEALESGYIDKIVKSFAEL